MMNRRTIAAALLAAMLVAPAGAVSLDEILQGAKDISPSYRNTVITHQNGLINLQRMEKGEDKVIVTAGGTLEPIMTTESDDYGIMANPTVKVVLPNDGSTTITGSMKVQSDYSGTARSISGNAGVTHTIDLIGYTSDHSDDISYATTRYTTELTFQRATLSFEKTVIATVSSLLSAEKNLVNMERNIAKQEANISNIVALGTYADDAPVLVNARNTLASLKASLEASRIQFQNSMENFEKLSGLKYDGLEELPEPVLELVTYENGNTSVYLTSLAAENALENYRRTLAAYYPNRIDINGSAAAGGNFDDRSNYSISGGASYVSDKWTASASAGVSFVESPAIMLNPASEVTTYSLAGSARYSESNWYVQVAPKATVTVSSVADTKVRPTVTISGSWTNDTTLDTKAMDLQRLQNTVQSTQNDYVAAMTSYTQEMQSLSVRILNWNYRKAQAEANLAYLRTVLENEETRHGLGLSTDTALGDARHNLSQAEYDWKTMILEGLSLQRDLEIFAL